MTTRTKRSTRPKGTNGAKPNTLSVEIDVDRLELEDLPTIALLGEMGTNAAAVFTSTNADRFIDLLDRAVVGGVRGKGFKLAEFGLLIGALVEAWTLAGNPETAEGN